MKKKAIAKYSAIINEIISKENSKHEVNTLTWVLGDKCLWLELRLDY